MLQTVFFCLLLAVLLISGQSNFLFGGDSAEYSTIVSTFSIPHAPGYPLYSLIGNVINRTIPFGTVTWKAGLLSSIPTVFTSLFIYLILFKLTRRKNISIFSSVFYVFLYPIWLYAEVPEVFALNNLFIVVITYLILKYNETQGKNIRYLIYLFIGFSVAHHHTFILFIPGWYLLLKKNLKNKFFLTNKIKNILTLMLGASFYLYPMIASYFNPPIDWENSQSINGLIRLILRTSYGSFSAYAGVSPDIKNQVFDFFSIFIFILQDYRILGVVFILLGMVSYLKKPNIFSKFLLITLFIQVFFIFYTNFYLKSNLIIATFERYLISMYLILIFYFANGLIYTKFLIKKYLFLLLKNNILRRIFLFSYFLFLIIFLYIIFSSNYSAIKYIKNTREFEIYGNNILNTLPKKSILYVAGDVPYFTVQYLYSVEKKRNDVRLIFANLLTRSYYAKKIKSKYPDVFIPDEKVSESLFYKEFLEKNSKNFSIFYEYPSPYGGYWQPYGLLWKYYDSPDLAKTDTKNLIDINNFLWSKYLLPKFNKEQKNILFLRHVEDLYKQSLVSYMNFLLTNDKFSDLENYLILSKNLLTKNQLLDYSALIAIKKKDCRELQKYIKNKKSTNVYELSLDQIKIFVKFYGLCDSNNQEVYLYLNIYKKFNQ